MAGKGSKKASKDARTLRKSPSKDAKRKAGKDLNDHKKQSHDK